MSLITYKDITNGLKVIGFLLQMIWEMSELMVCEMGSFGLTVIRTAMAFHIG